MNFFINFLEAIISSYTLCETCYVKNKKMYMFFMISLTFLSANICEIYQVNSWPLLILYISIWFILTSLFTKKNYLYNFFMVLLVNTIIDISFIFPLMFVYDKNVILAGLLAKIINFCLCFLFIKYQRRYSYLSYEYWILILLLLLLSLFIFETQLNNLIEHNISFSLFIIVVCSILIIIITLFFFFLIEKSNLEKEKLVENLEREKYKKITFDIINHEKEELNRIQHGLIYHILLIKNYLINQQTDDALSLADSYLKSMTKFQHMISTKNSILDTYLNFKLNHINYEIIPCINISFNDFYNNLNFIRFLLDILDNIEENSKVNFTMKESKHYCLLQLASHKSFINNDILEDILIPYKDILYNYYVKNNEDFYLIKISLRKDPYEKNL